ncbi:MAG: acylphosphatase [Thioalkalispiraceae bacterium]
MSICEICIVTGIVQGVFYRASTKQQADKLGVTGHVKNIPQGHVEVMICGAPEAVGHMKAWLWDGPAHAHVSNVQCELVENAEVPDSFQISY